MPTTSVSSRTFDGTPVPAPGAFTLDPVHSTVGFAVRHLMVAHVKGRFGSVTGTVVIGDDPLASWVEVSVETATIDTGDEQRDAHLRSPDFFDVEAHPMMTFASSKLRPSGGSCFELEGELTIKGVSRPVTLDARLEGIGVDPWGNERAGFSARAEIDRDAWGLTWNQTLGAGGVLIGRSVAIEIDAEIVRRSE
jgi:polyisoprenoid-binding protein YceI